MINSTIIVNNAGSKRRARRNQKSRKLTVPVRSSSATSNKVIKYPLMTKKTSTPRNPPGNQAELA